MSGRSRWIRRAAAIAVACAAAFCVLATFVYVFPPQQPPTKSDAIIVIGPPDQWRIDWAEQLMAEGIADRIVISTATAPYQPAACDAGDPRITCFTPTPFTTQGEARHVQALVQQNGWTHVTVITMTPHLVRTEYIFGRCLPEGVQVIGRSTGLYPARWIYQFGYQTAGFLKAFFVTTGC